MARVFAQRLLLLTEAFPPAVGGIQSYLAGLWGALPSQASFVVAPRAAGAPAWDAAQRYRIERIPMQSWWRVPRWRAAAAAARALVRREKIDAVVCGKALFEGRAAIRLHTEFGIPYVVCTYAMELPFWLASLETREDLRRVLDGAARVLVICEPTKQFLREFGVADDKIVKLYPGVADAWFQPIEGVGEYRQRHGLAGKRVIVSVGRLIPRKGHRTLIEAFPAVLRAVPGARLLIVGEGPERPALEQLVLRRGLLGAVGFRASADDREVREAVASADVFALTPRNDPREPEGFGIVYLEAAALGKPSVATRVGGVPEAVLDGETGFLIQPDAPDATAAALVKLLSDAELRERFGAAARARVARDFRWRGRALLFQGMVVSLLTG